MIVVKSRGSFRNTRKFLQHAANPNLTDVLIKYGYEGVAALYQATPKRTGKTAASWTFEIVQEGERITIYWKNTNVVEGNNIALLLQLGHGTGRGAYVKGRDYINPAIVPVFDRMADNVWMEVVGHE